MRLSFYNVQNYADEETSTIAIASLNPRANTLVDALMLLLSQELTL